MIREIFKVPLKDKGKNVPHHVAMSKDAIHQADIMFLPDDKGYKYLLNVVDVGSKIGDAEPLKTKSAEAVIQAFKKIYSRGILNIPLKIQVDSGSEFKGKTAKYFEENNICVRTAEPNRHRQQAVVERRNGMISRPLMERQTAQELITGERDKQWVEDLPEIIEKINISMKKKKKIRKSNRKPCLSRIFT